MLRDQALVASGLLVEKLGGPSVKPYQPDGLWDVAMGRPQYDQVERAPTCTAGASTRSGSGPSRRPR